MGNYEDGKFTRFMIFMAIVICLLCFIMILGLL